MQSGIQNVCHRENNAWEDSVVDHEKDGKMRKLVRAGILSSLVAAALLLQGCAATQLAITKGDLDVQTKMSATIFLDPVGPEQRTVYVQIRNTSDNQGFNMTPLVVAKLKEKGYRVVDDPNAAKYFLQANVLYVGKSSSTASQEAFGNGYGGALGVGMLAAGGGYAAGMRHGGSLAAVGLLGAAAEGITGAMFKDVYYTVVTDVQLQERLAAGKTAQLNSSQKIAQGTGGADKVTYKEETDRRKYQTRVVSTANKMNLEITEALPAVQQGLANSLAGLF